MPLLQHQTKKGLNQVIESAHCAEYIDDVFPSRNPLWPKDPKQRVAVRQLLEVGGATGFMFWMGTPAESWVEKLTDHAAKLKLLDNCLKTYGKEDADFLLGKHMCMAEVLLAPMVIRWVVALGIKGFDSLKFVSDLGLDRVSKWCKAIIERPSVKQSFPDPDPSMYDKMDVSYEIVDGKLANVKVAKA